MLMQLRVEKVQLVRWQKRLEKFGDISGARSIEAEKWHVQSLLRQAEGIWAKRKETVTAATVTVSVG